MEKEEFEKEIEEIKELFFAGVESYKEKNYEKVIELYSKYIDRCNAILSKQVSPEEKKQIESGLSDAYNNRGVSYAALGKHNEAIADYNKAIGINDKNDKNDIFYNNRGSSYAAQGKHKDAIADFSKAIEINPKYAKAYNNRGSSYAQIGKYDEAISDYSQAIKLGMLNIYFIKRLYYIKEYMDLVDKYRKYSEKIEFKQILILLFNLEEKVDKFSETQGISFSSNQNFSHYSSPALLNNLKEGKELKLRLYLTDYMDDPEEGKFLIKSTEELKYFYEGSYEDNYNCFVSSFVLEKIEENEYEDEAVNSLIFWRHYGKGIDGGVAEGVKIVIPEEFFELALNSLKKRKKEDSEAGTTSPAIQTSEGFFEVKYGKDSIEIFMEGISKSLEKIKKKITNIKKKIDIIDKKDIEEKLKSLVRIIIDEYRYIFKNGFYKEEREYRLIAIRPKGSTSIIEEEDSDKLYLEIEEDLFSVPNTKIILGPCMKNVDVLKPKLEHNLKKLENHGCRVTVSELPFRQL